MHLHAQSRGLQGRKPAGITLKESISMSNILCRLMQAAFVLKMQILTFYGLPQKRIFCPPFQPVGVNMQCISMQEVARFPQESAPPPVSTLRCASPQDGKGRLVEHGACAK